MFPKAWIREKESFCLLKDGDEDAVCRELLASQIRQCFAVRQVKYREAFFEEIRVSESDLVTSKQQSMVSKWLSIFMPAIMIWIHWKFVRKLIRKMDMHKFADRVKEAQMFQKKLEELYTDLAD